MSMKALSDPQVGITGLKPGGWTAAGLGFWMRPADQAFLYQRGIPNMTAEQVRLNLLPMYDLPKLGERIGRQKTAALQWDLYHAETRGGPADEPFLVDAALAQVGKWAYLILVAGPVPASPELHKEVFLPALQAIAPFYTGAEAVSVAKERGKKYTDNVREVRDWMKCGLTVETDFVSDQMKGVAMPPSQKAPDPSGERIPLPKPDASTPKKSDLFACIADRKSRRKYSAADLTLDELSYLLWATQGVRKALPTGRHYRTVPSAGSRHAFETYLVIQHVKGLKPGVYRYLPFDHQLAYLFTAEDLPEKMTALSSNQVFVGNSAVCFLWSALPYRMEWRYGLGSERVILMDVGHVCQNLYLAAESIGCGTCGVAAYEQAALDKFLGLDGKDEFVIYLAPVGKVAGVQEE